jgi:hypothetical protein
MLASATLVLAAAGCDVPRSPCHYLIPDGYVGWLRVDYGVNAAHAPGFGVKSALPLPVKDGILLYEFPPSGHLVTSSSMGYGSAKDEYFYVADGRRVPLSQAHDTGMVWGGFNGRAGGAASQTQFFFIGTKADFDEFGKLDAAVPKTGPIRR